KASVRKVIDRAQSIKAKATVVAEKAASNASSTAAAPAKKISQKFLEVMEKRKSQGGWGARKGAMFGRPARRGRRPKASAEYTPEHSNEEAYVLESESYERIEYDTGISYKTQGGGNGLSDDTGFSLDRFDDFDEELNFDR